MSPFLRLIGIVRPYYGWMALAALISFAATGSGIGLLMTAAWLIAKAALQPPLAALQLGIVGVRFFGIARALFRYLERLVSHDATFRILTRLRVWFYDALEPLAPARLLGYRSGDLLQRIVDDIQGLENLYTRVLAPPLTAAMVALLMWFLLGTWSFEAALVLLLFHLLAGLGLPLLTAALGRGVSSGILKAKAEEQVLALDFTQGLGELYLFGRLPEHLEKLAEVEGRKLALERRKAVVEGVSDMLGGVLVNAAVVVVLLVMLPLVETGTASGISLSIVTLAVMASFEALHPLPAAVGHLEADIHAGNRLFEIIDAKPEVSIPAAPKPMPTGTAIKAEQLSFTYPGSHRPALASISFSLPPGSRTAVVGPSGSGKSTLAALLVRFRQPCSGSITLGGTDIGELDPEALRRRIALVSQKTYLFAETLRDNLLLAKPEATDAELEAALTAAGLPHFSRKLDTFAGQHGMQLSGGERQRMAIARALLQGAPLLILDEATASLDSLTEQQVHRALEQLAEGRTTLAITHRLYDMERYDRILVLQEGKLVEEGTHAELVERGGLYRRMWGECKRGGGM